jgi:hypothetical protein
MFFRRFSLVTIVLLAAPACGEKATNSEIKESPSSIVNSYRVQFGASRPTQASELSGAKLYCQEAIALTDRYGFAPKVKFQLEQVSPIALDVKGFNTTFDKWKDARAPIISTFKQINDELEGVYRYGGVEYKTVLRTKSIIRDSSGKAISGYIFGENRVNMSYDDSYGAAYRATAQQYGPVSLLADDSNPVYSYLYCIISDK